MKSTIFLLVAITIQLNLSSAIPFEGDQGDQDWWKHAVFYQIYPRSFKDSDNDGVGDLRGIMDKLDHLKDAGVTATWLSPIYASPQVDQGYDISDYRAIDPAYGTMDDMKALISKAKELGLKIIMDLVPNHTSNKHKWFIESEKGTEKYRDYYVWQDGKVNETTGERKPPNNWISIFSNSAWSWSETRQQWYLHDFAPGQPDLNYRNPAVVEEIKDVMRFWMDLGVEGFRIDAIPFLVEDLELRDEPRSKNDVPSNDAAYLDHIYTQDQPETFEVVYQLRKLVDDYVDEHGGDAKVLMTEAYTTLENTMLYYGSKDRKTPGAHFSFNFYFLQNLNADSTAQDFVTYINNWLNAIPDIYVSNWVFGNHDNHRMATTMGKENVDGCNMLLGVLPGVAVTYNGEEIGQENGEVKYEEGQDPSARDPALFEQKSRDFERTPFQWDKTVNAGFNDGAKPWLPVSKKYVETNLVDQINSSGPTHYKLYKYLHNYRRHSEVLKEGTTEVKALSNVVVVKRVLDNQSLLYLFNVGDESQTVNINDLIGNQQAEVLFASIESKRQPGETLKSDIEYTLGGHEAIIYITKNES